MPNISILMTQGELISFLKELVLCSSQLIYISKINNISIVLSDDIDNKQVQKELCKFLERQLNKED